jgi:hypothetical protein
MPNMETEDLKRLYAQINAHRHLLTVCVHAVLQLAGNQREEAREAMRIAAMDLADRQQLRPGEPNVEFGLDAQVEALRIVAEFFEKDVPPAK